MAALSVAETVTVCAMLQLPTVKVSVSLLSVAPDRLTAVLACPAIETVTLPEGWVASATVYSLLRPATTLSAVGSIVTPAVSFSVMLTSTSGTVVEP